MRTQAREKQRRFFPRKMEERKEAPTGGSKKTISEGNVPLPFSTTMLGCFSFSIQYDTD
jgi:hypothetical protein